MTKKVNEAAEGEKALSEVRLKGQEGIVEEKNKIEALVRVASDETKALGNRQAAVKALNKIIPNYNAQLDATTGKYKANKKALDAYLQSLTRKYEIEGAKDMLKEIGKQKAKLNMEIKELDDEAAEYDAKQRKIESGGASTTSQAYGVAGGTMASYSGATNGAMAAVKRGKANDKRKDLKKLEARENAITGAYGDDIANDAATETNNRPVITPSSGGSAPVVDKKKKKTKANKFKEEINWQKEQNAINKEAYMKGEKDYEAYVTRMEEIEMEYYKKIIANKKADKAEVAEAKAGLAEAEKKQRDRLNSAEEWKAKEEALNRIAYAKGEKNYEQYTSRMDEINVQYWKKRMNRNDLSAKDLLEAQAQYQEALKKQTDNAVGRSREAEDKAYYEQLAALKQRFIDGESDYKTYENAVELAELEHLRKVVSLYKEGTKERLAAEKEYQDKVFANQQAIIARQKQV